MKENTSNSDVKQALGSDSLLSKAQSSKADILTWIPHQVFIKVMRIARGGDDLSISAQIADNGDISVAQSMNEHDASSSSVPEGFVAYDLMAVVSHIHDPSCQNIVAHIKVDLHLSFLSYVLHVTTLILLFRLLRSITS